MWLADWHKRPGFCPLSAVHASSPLSLVISRFWFKVTDVRLSLSLEHLEATAGLLTGLI